MHETATHETAVAGLRERKKQKTRDLITSVALELFAARGFQATTVAEIAEAAEISDRTVFTYFPTKEDILFSDHDAMQDALVVALEERPPGVSTLDALREFIVDNLGAADEQARLRWQIVSHDDQLHSHQRARHADFGHTIGAAVAAELGEDPDDLRPQLVTAAVIAAFTAAYEHRYNTRSHAESRTQAIAVIDETITFLRGGLEAIRAYPKPY